MKKFVLFVCALAFATSTLAAQNKPKASYDGVIESYDTATKTLTVKRGDKQGQFVIIDTSEVFQGKTKADPSALTVGNKVDLDFVMDGATKQIVKVKVGAPATKK